MIHHKYSLEKHNTFGIDVIADHFAEFKSENELVSLISNDEFRGMQILVLGGGSNVLFEDDFHGLVLRNSIKGIEIVKEDDDYVYVKAGAGEVWHHLVIWAVGRNLGGIENLSLIPGSVGAAPIQNIGAYGVELKDSFYQLETIDIGTGKKSVFGRDQCMFGYRDSIFKRNLKGKIVITTVILALRKLPELKLSYGAIQQTLESMNISKPGVKDVCDAVISIRRSKLPDPAELGNAGSFFKNPEIPASQFDALRSDHPGIVGYPVPGGGVKVAAGWLIEQCGWKGKRVGNVGSHARQALVLVNYGGATGSEIVKLSQDILNSVYEKFGIQIEPEVNIIRNL